MFQIFFCCGVKAVVIVDSGKKRSVLRQFSVPLNAPESHISGNFFRRRISTLRTWRNVYPSKKKCELLKQAALQRAHNLTYISLNEMACDCIYSTIKVSYPCISAARTQGSVNYKHMHKYMIGRLFSQFLKIIVKYENNLKFTFVCI